MKPLNSYAELLDQSCAECLTTWVAACNINSTWLNADARDASEKLRSDLGSYRMPVYDSIYVPAAYVARYQLSHICMAKAALGLLNGLREPNQNVIRIVDFGSGASACRIATALLIAESLESNNPIDHVQFFEVDTSQFMQLMGRCVWGTFVGKIRSDFSGSYLAQAVDSIDVVQVPHEKEIPRNKTYTWLSAFHAIYPAGYDMKAAITKVFNRVNPSLGVFTCHSWKLPYLRPVSPFLYQIEWHEGKYGKYPENHSFSPGRTRCPSMHMAKKAKSLGLRDQAYQPLQAMGCAVLWGFTNQTDMINAKMISAIERLRKFE